MPKAWKFSRKNLISSAKGAKKVVQKWEHRGHGPPWCAKGPALWQYKISFGVSPEMSSKIRLSVTVIDFESIGIISDLKHLLEFWHTCVNWLKYIKISFGILRYFLGHLQESSDIEILLEWENTLLLTTMSERL